MSDRGQAHAFAVVIAALAAATITGLVAAEQRMLADARGRRAAEAAAQAAGAAVADAHVAFLRSLTDASGAPREPSDAETAAFVADPRVAEAALAASWELAERNGAARPTDVVVRDAGDEIEVEVRVGRSVQRVAFAKIACCRR